MAQFWMIPQHCATASDMTTNMDANAHPLPPSTSDDLHAMVEAALHAGALLMKAYAHRADLNVSEKTVGDFVSDADRAAEAAIKARLNAAYGWVGEESETRAGTVGNLRWIVDPLDGTTNFLKGLPHWAVSIALCDGNNIQCAVIHDPVKRETFTAEKGHGAYLNGIPISVSRDVPLQSAVFATGVPAGGRITYLPHCLQDLEKLMPNTAGVRRWGAAALDLAYVAAGRVEGYWERNLGPWDIAAGALLVTEAGGQIIPLWEGTDILSSGSFIATNADLGPALASALDRVR